MYAPVSRGSGWRTSIEFREPRSAKSSTTAPDKVTLRRSTIAPQFPSCNSIAKLVGLTRQQRHASAYATCLAPVSGGLHSEPDLATSGLRRADGSWMRRSQRRSGRDERHLAGRARRRAERTSWIGSLDPARQPARVRVAPRRPCRELAWHLLAPCYYITTNACIATQRSQ